MGMKRYEVHSGNILMYSPYSWRVVDTLTPQIVVAMTIDKNVAERICKMLNDEEETPRKGDDNGNTARDR